MGCPKFAGYWDDTKRDHGEMVDLTFVYYLEDDTMQIIEVEKPNSGKGPFTKLWVRAKLLKDWEKDYFGTPDVDRRVLLLQRLSDREHRVRLWSPRENLCHRRRHSGVVSE